MKKNTKIMILVGVALIVLVGAIGITFAYLSTGGSQEQANTFNSGCLSISLTNESASINLTSAYPISDIEGLETTSYDFTITNNCNSATNYQINLESLGQESDTTLGADYIKVSLSSDTVGNVISKLSDNTEVTPELDGAYASHNLYTTSIGANESKTYHLKLWIDYDATVAQAANKTYTSKINVIANPETQVIDILEATFELNDKTVTANLTNKVTSATYCTTTDNICAPSTNANISNSSYSVDLERNDNKQMVCTRLNGTSKVICSSSIDISPSIKDTLLAYYPTVLTRTDFSTTVTDTTTGVIYKSTDESQYDNDGEVYYFAGNPTDNWVSFAGFYWRIIRINGNGSIRLIYSGNESSGPVTTGTDTQTGTSAFNSERDDNAYVGYMYGTANSTTYAETHENINSSTIKSNVDTWYQSNLLNYENFMDDNAGFCGDRSAYNDTNGLQSGNSNYGANDTTTYYGAYVRLRTNKNPSFKCTNIADLYTTSNASKGNQALTYSVGLIAVDEMVYAGGVYNTNNSGY